MAFDGAVVSALCAQLNSKLTGGRVDKVSQPEKDEIVISVRSLGENHRLLLSANPSNPRIHLTKGSKENPISAPMFCMLLRKHLIPGKIVSVSQPDFERLLRIEFEGYNELGDLTQKSLIIEIMGRHSNIILIDSEGKIIDSIVHVDFSVSSVRQVLPGRPYSLPPSQNKLNPLTSSHNDISEILKDAVSRSSVNIPADKFILSNFTGISPLLAREAVFRFCKNCDLSLTSMNEDEISRFSLSIFEFFSLLKKQEFSPCVLSKKENGKPFEFSCVSIQQYENSANVEAFADISCALENFYFVKDMKERMSQRSSDLSRLIANNIERCAKKLALHSSKLKDAENKEKHKIFGDLLTANLHCIEKGESSVTLPNFYNNNVPVSIQLDASMSPSKNAQRYYKLYNKAKGAEKSAAEQIALCKGELVYLETVADAVSKASNADELNEIRHELAETGYMRPAAQKKGAKRVSATMPHEFKSSDGFKIFVGKNNRQNDMLTLKMSTPNDIWFHTKTIAGSHTVIKTDGSANIPEQTLLEAATLAAYFSKARSSSNVPIDYTAVKNVKKPSGAKPGMVIYDNYSTLYVTPDEELIEKLSKR